MQNFIYSLKNKNFMLFEVLFLILKILSNWKVKNLACFEQSIEKAVLCNNDQLI